MIIPGKTMDDHLSSVAGRMSEWDVLDEKDIECIAGIHPTKAFLSFRNGFDEEFPNRPYLHIMGECHSLRRADNTPLYGNVNRVTFNEDSKFDVDIFYEFTDEELSHLVMLGMYRRGFECPSLFSTGDVEIEMPVYSEMRVVEPQDVRGVPIIFMDIEDRHAIFTEAEHCGYTFGDYFEPAKDVEMSISADVEEYVEYKDAMQQSLFGEDEREHEVYEEAEKETESEAERILREHYENVQERVKTHYKPLEKTEQSEMVDDVQKEDDDKILLEASDSLQNDSNEQVQSDVPESEETPTDESEELEGTDNEPEGDEDDDMFFNEQEGNFVNPGEQDDEWHRKLPNEPRQEDTNDFGRSY